MDNEYELCWKCKEERNKMGYPTTIPGDHCHHEPKEKPKSVCSVCGYGTFRVSVDNWSNWPSRPKLNILIHFCPWCGRDLR